MVAALRIDIPDHERLTAQLRGLSKELRIEQRQSIAKVLTIAQDAARERIHSPAGHAAKGIVQRVSGSGGHIVGKLQPGAGRAGRAMIFAQRSRGAGTTPPPARMVRVWARTQGINPWALARSIGQKGTKGRPIMRDAFSAVRGQVIQAFVQSLRTIAAKVRA